MDILHFYFVWLIETMSSSCHVADLYTLVCSENGISLVVPLLFSQGFINGNVPLTLLNLALYIFLNPIKFNGVKLKSLLLQLSLHRPTWGEEFITSLHVISFFKWSPVLRWYYLLPWKYQTYSTILQVIYLLYVDFKEDWTLYHIQTMPGCLHCVCSDSLKFNCEPLEFSFFSRA